jgi:putative PIN family toxin of toxin-antitoxin system
MPVVIDTGVVVSALLLPRSVPRKAFDRAASEGKLLLSEATLAELDEVLRRPKFNRYLPEDKRLEFLSVLVRDAVIVEIAASITECRDPKDNKFLELAVDGRATHLITGDSDLLDMHPFRGIAILSPKDFVAQLSKGESP